MSEPAGEPDRYAVVGFPVKHSQSPTIHRLFAEQTGQNLTYDLIEADAEAFEAAVQGFIHAGGKGLNVTVPHKERALGLATHVSNEARIARAANTLDFRQGAIRAFNTDGSGLIRDLRDNLDVVLKDRRVLILGAGGAVRGIVAPLLDAGIAQLTVANRTLARAEQLQASFRDQYEFVICGFGDLERLDAPDIIVNATSAGIKGEAAPFPTSLFRDWTVCYDLSYSLHETPFERLARAAGAKRAVQGWGMLVEQAADAFEIWRGIRPQTRPILERLRR
ncbi:MAG: shikimate dehydrogenase [Gammaproteobacteria bacterium]